VASLVENFHGEGMLVLESI